jgi:transposase InsO family protein
MKTDHPILKLCAILQVSASGYYDWATRQSTPGPRALEDLDLAREIAAIHAESRETYGGPRVAAVLRSRGRRHGRNRIARLMTQQGLRGRQKGRYRVQTTDSNHDHPIAPNHLAVAPVASAPNQIWVADITYILTREGWLYLAGILDLFSRRIVGWAMSESIDSALVIDALNMALLHREPPADLLFHSDRGVQYAAGDFRNALARASLVPSMSRRGNCYDNAFMESFWSTLKLDLVYRREFATRGQARAEIFDYIEVFYNRQRLHTSLGCVSPNAFELAALESKPARRRSPMGVEPMRDGAQRTPGHGPQRATGAPLGGDAATLAQDCPPAISCKTSVPQTNR